MTELDIGAIRTSLPYLLQGRAFSLKLTLAAFAGGMIISISLALSRHLELPVLKTTAAFFITLMRSIPLLIVLFWFFFLMPLILGWLSGGGPVPIGGIATAYITFILFEDAYYAEIILAGLRDPAGSV